MITSIIDKYFPPCGACFCGHPDARHRIFDAIQDRLRAGDSIEETADDFDVPIEVVGAILNLKKTTLNYYEKPSHSR